jgi:hypothetical protein
MKDPLLQLLVVLFSYALKLKEITCEEIAQPLFLSPLLPSAFSVLPCERGLKFKAISFSSSTSSHPFKGTQATRLRPKNSTLQFPLAFRKG